MKLIRRHYGLDTANAKVYRTANKFTIDIPITGSKSITETVNWKVPYADELINTSPNEVTGGDVAHAEVAVNNDYTWFYLAFQLADRTDEKGYRTITSWYCPGQKTVLDKCTVCKRTSDSF